MRYRYITVHTAGLLLAELLLSQPLPLLAQAPKAGSNSVPGQLITSPPPAAGRLYTWEGVKSDTLPLLAVSYGKGPLAIKGTTQSKASWNLPEKLGKQRDTLLVRRQDQQGEYLFVHPQAKWQRGEELTQLQVPAQRQLELHTGWGNVTVEDYQGRLHLEAENGTIALRKVQGPLHLHTGEGSVTVRESQGSGLVSTGKGDVLLENVEGDLYGFTREGNVVRRYTSAYMHRQASRTPFATSQSEGRLEVEVLPEGGTLRVQKGSIHVGTTRKALKATVEEGDIAIRDAQAGVTATTRQGNLTVQVSGIASPEPVTLTASRGDITVILPGNFSGELQVEILQSNLTRTYRIENAFQGSAARVWPYGQGVPEANQPGAVQTEEIKDASGKLQRRTIRLQQFLGQGPDPNRRADARRKPITIRVENGNVKIQKDR